MIKDSKLKVQAQIQGDKVRVIGKKRDDLQEAIALLRKGELRSAAAVQQFPRLIAASAARGPPSSLRPFPALHALGNDHGPVELDDDRVDVLEPIVDFHGRSGPSTKAVFDKPSVRVA